MFSKAFLKDTLERSLSSGAQFALLSLGGQELSIVDKGWLVAVYAFLGGFLLTIVKCIAAYNVGDKDASLIK